MVLVGLVAGYDMRACAQTRGSETEIQPGAWSKFLRSIGINPSKPSSDIDYTERSPLVVPPTRDLAQPQASAAMPPTDWPKDPTKSANRAKPKAGLVPGTAVETPNPPHEKKPWYNPTGWFDKEEYAKFAGEPVRQDLTEPPAGYRSPSPEQPYGLSAETKAYKPTATDFGYTGTSSGH